MSNRRTAQSLAWLMFALLGFTGAADAQSPQPPAETPPQAPPQYSATLHVGDPAPAFKLPGSDGKTHSLSDSKGKTVVLAWFPKAFTGG